jgi:aldehyde:ferredoxin oxidoreductase
MNYSLRYILNVDLSDGSIRRESTEPYAARFVGGRGVGSKILYEKLPPQNDPLGPDNVLVLSTGPLSGTAAAASGRTDVSAQSPLNNFHGVTNFGGFWGAELSQAGYNHLVFTGASDTPVFLFIDNDHVELRDARHLWGLDTFATIRALRKQLNDEDIQVIAIGPAGENRVRFAAINASMGNAAGRMGMGAVMGSKNLKAVAVRGTKGVDLHNPRKFMDLALDTHKFLKDSAAFKNFTKSKALGDPMFSKKAANDMPFGNYETGFWEAYLHLKPEDFFAKHKIRRTGCFGCPLQCMHLVRIPASEFGISHCLNFLSFSGTVWNDDLTTMWQAIDLANRYGLDAHETGGIIAFLMELYENGIISRKDTDGIAMEKGSREAILQMVHKIARREGIGDVLAEGPQRAAEEIGGDAPQYVVAAKGLFPHGYQFQVLEGNSLMQAVSSGEPFQTYGTGIERTIDPDNPDPGLVAQARELYGSEKAYLPGNYSLSKVRMVIDAEHRCRVPDLLGICLTSMVYVLKGIPDIHFLYDRQAQLFSAATGHALNRHDLFEAAERLVNIERCIDGRQGLTRADDRLPKRFFEPFDNGANAGKALDAEKMEEMKTVYYRTRGWDPKSGLPTREKLSELNLADIT